MTKMRDHIYHFCRETSQEPPVDLVEFSEWLSVHEADAAVELEKHAADVLNHMFERLSVTVQR